MKQNNTVCTCRNCGCNHHCNTECDDCKNDVCVKCDCDICNPKIKVSSNWQWQDSGIELGF